jgi:hypothetical protein
VRILIRLADTESNSLQRIQPLFGFPGHWTKTLQPLMVRASLSLGIDIDDDVTLAKANDEPMDINDEWHRFSPVLVGVAVPPPLLPVEDIGHTPAIAMRMAEKLPGRAGPASSSSKVKVEDPDWRAGVVECSKVIGEASDKASTSSLIKQSSSIEDFFLASNGQSPNLAVGDRWLKVSRTPGRNLDNESVLLDDASMDKSHLAITGRFGL